MAKKSEIKICRYWQCKHTTKDIDISCDEYVVKGRMYYHKDCYKAKVSGEWKDETVKSDLQLIKNLWFKHISKTVVCSQLFMVLNDLIERGIESAYLVFVMNYIIEHKMNLNYPAGFRYYVDNPDIKKAYEKKNRKIIPPTEFVATDNEDNAPKFSVNKKPSGFNSILGG